MFIGKVVGSLWATRKTENTKGVKFLIVQPYNLNKEPNTDTIVAADTLGAGEGELVMVAYGRAARVAVGNEDMTIEAAIIGIIDEYEVDPGHYHGDLEPSRQSYKKQ
ncbi:ethanolamine utilization protein EutN [candidate division GN15 bacterium]|jgi:ethanolamine utilization protein EutN|nr:ethanolamine utilization protein EutN [candidate division GN15 bacterium]